jgi:preprotein translocase SecE subunit
MARQPRRRVSTAATAGATASPGGERRLRDNMPRPTAAPVSQGIARPQPQVHRRRNPLAGLARIQPRFAADIVAELKKVTWPTFAETRYLTIVVAIVAVAVGIFLGLLDLLFGWFIERLFF